MNLSRYTVPSLGLMLVMGLGCQPNVQSIDRTQPNALHKSQFSGLYYTRATVVEADPESPAVQGITSDMDKIRWDISEEYLTAYRSYEFVPYAEGLNDEGRDFFGSMVAQYRILSHFDIQRDYNATTGRTGNIVGENTADRPWYEREYIRVDWSTNRVGRQTRFWTGWVNYPDAYFSGVSAASYYHQGHEETNINRPVFTDGYFDVTNQYTLEPSVYYCIVNLFWQGVGRCGAANVRVRLSFNRIDPAEDYQPLYYPDVVYLRDDNGEAIVLNGDGRGCSEYTPTSCEYETYEMDAAFGNFRISRQAFDQERTFTNTGRLYVAGRFDLWQKSYDESGAVIPYANREAKPIIYYSSVGFPDDLEGQVQSMADSWAKPFEEVVAFRKGYRTAEGDLDLGRVQADVGGHMYQVVKNSCNRENVKAYAEANGLTDVVDRIAGSVDTVHDGNLEQVCAAMQYVELQNGKTLDAKLAEREEGMEMAFNWQRKGDLRHNMQNYIHPLSNGPWGVAQFGQDPETGEFVGANVANYFGDAGDFITQRGVDIIQWLNGDADEEALFRGELTRNSQVRRKALGTDRRVRGQVRDALMAHEGNLMEESGDSLFRLAPIDADERRMKQIFGGTEIEREFLVNDELLRGLAGPTMYQPAGAPTPEIGSGGAFGLANQPLPGEITGEAMDMASPLNWGTNPMTNEFSRAARELGGSGFELASFFDPNMAGMAARYKGMERDAIWSDLRGVLFNAVQMHEVGHTLGLRHNFSSSMDPLNYQKNFWYEERPDGPAIERWAELDPTPGNEMSIRNELKYASIMDYGFDLSLEGIHGIGEYDAAAIRFQYGQMVDYWDAGKISVPDPRKYGSFARRCGHNSDFWGVPALLNWLGPEHLPRVLSQAGSNQEACSRNYDNDESCDSQLDEIYREFVTRIEAVAAREEQPSNCTIFITEVNWLIEQVKDLPPNASGIFGGRSYTTVEEMVSQRIQVLDNVPEYDDPSTNIDESTDGFDDDGDGIADDKGYDWSTYKYQVPYNYCSDFFAGFNVACQRWDTGWDFLESTRYHVDRIDRDYIFDHYRRDAAQNFFSSFENPRAYIARLQSRRLFHLTNVYRYYLYSRRSAFDADYLVDWAEAAYEGVNALERMLQEVEPGTYCLDADNVYRLKTSDTQQCNEEFETGIGYGGGRFLNSSWTNEYYYKANRIGYMYDKWAAIQQMTTSAGFFARDLSDLFDRRAFSLGYLRVYLDPIMQRWAALVEGTHEGYRPRVIPEIRSDDEQQVGDNGTGKYVRYMPFFDEEFEGGESVREYLTQYPEIEPAWSYDLSYWALAYGIGNWSGLYDYAPEFKNFAKVAIEGTPEDVAWRDRTLVEFTDPSTLLTYRAPIIEPFSPGGLIQEFPVYYGDAFHRARGQFRNWGIGANLLTRANTLMDDDYNPAQLACTDGTTNVGAGQRWETQEDACASFEVAQNQLQELVGYIDRVRKFVRRAEFPD